MPEAHWDATAGKVKDTFGQHVNDLTSFKAEQDSRKLTLPQQADGYKAEFPKEWKPPAGFEDFKIKADDPLIPLYQQFAHKAGLSQEQFSEGFGLLASMRVGEAQMHKQASDAEVQKLGANGPSRVTAVNTWLNAQLGDDAKVFTQFPVIASMVTAYEKLMQRFSSQGVGGNNGTRREPAEGGMTAENYNKMTPRERLSYATSKQAPDAWRKQAEHVS